jgi:hypothetical protein
MFFDFDVHELMIQLNDKFQEIYIFLSLKINEFGFNGLLIWFFWIKTLVVLVKAMKLIIKTKR